MGRILSSALTAALVVGAVAIAQPAQAAPYFTTTPPSGCYLDSYTHQGFVYSAMTSCAGGQGLHRAVAQCADGETVYGFAAEMEYSRTSIAECRSSVYPWAPKPAVAVWGEYWIDF